MWTKTPKCEEKDVSQRYKAVTPINTETAFFPSKYTSQFIIQYFLVYLIFLSFGRTGTRSALFSPAWYCIYKALHKYLCNQWMWKAHKVRPLWNQKYFLKLFKVLTCNSLHPEGNSEWPLILLKISLLSFPSTYQLFSHTAALASTLLCWPFFPPPTFLPILHHKRPKATLDSRASPRLRGPERGKTLSQIQGPGEGKIKNTFYVCSCIT